MAARSRFSAQTLSVLAVLFAEPAAWRHGYGIAKDTGLKSGSLYPILIRLAERGLVEACWEAEQPAGRPRRHLYRLTAGGRAEAAAALADRQASLAGGIRRRQGHRAAPQGASWAG